MVKKRGGKRPGAGRKPKSPSGKKVWISARLDPETVRKIDKEREKEAIGRGEVIDRKFKEDPK